MVLLMVGVERDLGGSFPSLRRIFCGLSPSSALEDLAARGDIKGFRVPVDDWLRLLDRWVFPDIEFTELVDEVRWCSGDPFCKSDSV